MVSGEKSFRRKRQLPYGSDFSSDVCPPLDGPQLGWINCTQFTSHRECKAGCFPGHAFRGDEGETMTLSCYGGIWTPQHFFPSCQSLSLCELEYPGGSSLNCTLWSGGITLCDITCNGLQKGRYECYGQQWRPPLPGCTKANTTMRCAKPEFKGESFFNCTIGMEGTRCDVWCDGVSEGRYHCYPGRKWSPALPTCVRDVAAGNSDDDYCEEPEVPENGRVLHRSDTRNRQSSVGSEIWYVCAEGYQMEGPGRISCLSKGQWSSPPPQCHLPATPVSAPVMEMECGDPGLISNGYYLSPYGRREPTYPAGTSLNYSCYEPFILQGRESITCETSGFFSDDPPSCVEDCGRSFVSAHERMHYGTKTRPGEWPWTVAISNDAGRLVCSGLLIDQGTVLTAAHCLVDYPHYVLRFGKYFLENTLDKEVLVSNLTRIILHEGYDHSTGTYVADIALIKFYPPIRRYTHKIRPICLPTRSTTAVNLRPQNNGYVSGWGIDERGNPPVAMLAVTLPVQSREKCEEKHGQLIRAGMFCAGHDVATHESGTRTASVCTGDSGSGLVFDGFHQRFTVEGLVSFHMSGDCGMPGRYAIFTKVSYYMSWIQEHIVGSTLRKPPG